ncbi:MAG TPA: hypothetical protein DEW46_16225 [Verrucomicrobia bacterium]|nr:hypothetical protein [Verrucomicrobiota bacterium]
MISEIRLYAHPISIDTFEAPDMAEQMGDNSMPGSDTGDGPIPDLLPEAIGLRRTHANLDLSR